MTTPWTVSPFPFPKSARLVVGVSGGADSLGLLLLLKEQWPKAPRRLVVAHVNYGLRGKDSLRDEERVRRLCRDWGIPFRVRRIQAFAGKIKREKRSPQDLAREIRYSFFLKLVQKERAWGAAVAHHKEDQAETVLDRFLRGAGTRGFSGLRPVQKLHFHPGGTLRVWRPLLSFSKTQIQDFLKSRGITWREDKSNQGKKYRRNQIRHEILPFLSRWNPNLPEGLARVGEISSAEDLLLEDLLKPLGQKVKSRWRKTFYSCHSSDFTRVPLALQRRWVRHVCEKLNPKARGLSFDRIEEIIRLWTGTEKGPRDMGFGLAAGKSQNEAYLSWKRE